MTGDVRVADADGARVVWAPRSGPVRGGVVVRSGTADEALTEAGSAHLIEHLVRAGLVAR